MKIERATKAQAPKLTLKDLPTGAVFILRDNPDLGPFMTIKAYGDAIKECYGGGRWLLNLDSGAIGWSNETSEVVVLDAKVVIS